MKPIFAVAFAAHSLAASSAAIAGPASGSNYEWRSAPQPGPNKSNLPAMRRVRAPGPAPTMTMGQSKMVSACAATTYGKANQAHSG